MPETPAAPFDIQAGVPYFLHSSTKTLWHYCGLSMTEPIELQLAQGLNAIGVPTSSQGYTSASIAAAIDATGGDVAQIDRWDEFLGRWESFISQFPFNDFEIQSYKGYFLVANKSSSFSP
jgi:hypothetical protein